MKFKALLLIISLTAACSDSPPGITLSTTSPSPSPSATEKPAEKAAANSRDYARHFSGSRDGATISLWYNVTNAVSEGKRVIVLDGELAWLQPTKKSTSPLIPDQEASATYFTVDAKRDADDKVTDFVLTISETKGSMKVEHNSLYLSEKCKNLKIQPGSLCLAYYLPLPRKDDTPPIPEGPPIEIEMRVQPDDKVTAAKK